MTDSIRNQDHTKIKPSKVLHKESYRKTLKSVQIHHKTSKNLFSRLLHAKGMDNLHDFLASTFIHPKVLLSATIFTLIGELISIYMSEIFGYSYNYLLFVYFFVLGYLVSITYLLIRSRFNK